MRRKWQDHVVFAKNGSRRTGESCGRAWRLTTVREVISGFRDLGRPYLNQDILGSASKKSMAGRDVFNDYRAFSDLTVKLGSEGREGNGAW